MCSSICKCIGCKNFEESPERKTLMHLADAAEVRVQQQTAAKTKLSSQISDLLTRPAPVLTSGGGRCVHFWFVSFVPFLARKNRVPKCFLPLFPLLAAKLFLFSFMASAITDHESEIQCIDEGVLVL